MLDFSEFINRCQEQILPLLKISSPEELEIFHKKITSCAKVANSLYYDKWNEWKKENDILDLWNIIPTESTSLLNLIQAYELSSETQEIIIYEEKTFKKFSLLDPSFFIKNNFYSKQNIFFYILLGELLLEDNFAKFQLYGVMLRVRGLLKIESPRDKE